MQTRRWLNPSQPQTLQIAVILLYINAVFSAITFLPLLMLIGVAFAFAGYGIANERKWGYQLGVAAAGLEVALFVILPLATDPARIFSPAFLLTALFPVALFALLLHPMSRDYQRIWFE